VLGVCVVTRRDDVAAVSGQFGWDGGYGTSWASDRREDMVAILMTSDCGRLLALQVSISTFGPRPTRRSTIERGEKSMLIRGCQKRRSGS
jgi:CubicO group peptidase (beta-lactamase class C family)